MLLNRLDDFSENFLVVGGLYDRHQRLFDAALFHPAFRETELSIKVFWRHVYRVLDRDDVKSRKVLEVKDRLQVLSLFNNGSPFEGEIEETNSVRARFSG